MAVDRAEVQVDRCFVTVHGQVRQVTEITVDGRVQYLARGSWSDEPWGPGSVLSNPPSLDEFCNEVDRRVRCDWDSRYPERPPED
jgi:hypothetical protein